MQRAHWLSHLVSVGGVALVFAGCGDDSGGTKDSGPPDSGPAVPADAGNDSGMMTPMGPPMSDDYTLAACPGAAPVAMIDLIGSLPDCSDICGDGRCVPPGFAGGASAAAGALPMCADGMSTCIPVAIAQTGGAFQFQPCTSPLDKDMTGACVPTCLVPADMRLFLMMETCGAGELCAPCTSPLDNMPTGACDFLECGGGADGGSDSGSDDGG